jgi:hypothetical protein
MTKSKIRIDRGRIVFYICMLNERKIKADRLLGWPENPHRQSSIQQQRKTINSFEFDVEVLIKIDKVLP